nr:2'-5' RNA ligase family protein [Nanoarchaeota archaeon]
MSEIAIDVTIIPPEEIMDKAVSISKKLFEETRNKEIVLDKEKCIPHITLVMICIDENNLDDIKKIVEEVALQTKSLNLKFVETEIGPTPDGGKVSGLKIERTPEILELHETMIKKTNPYRKKEATIKALYPNPKPNEATLTWINAYERHSSFEKKYNAHLTIGFGELKNVELPITFTASKIAVCQLGNYCTCRKMLFEVDLKE